MITHNPYVLEMTDLLYDKNHLLQIFNQSKHCARLKGLKWRENPKFLIGIDNASSVVIQYGDNMMLDNNKNYLSYNFLEHDYIKNIIDKLNFNHEILPSNIDIIWYRPGFIFEPHTDHYAASTMMFPIFPEDGGEPVDFYHKDNLEVIKGSAKNYDQLVDETNIVYTHYYNTSYPTIFNSHKIHGVRKVLNQRAFLRLRINEDFESIVDKYKNKKLIKNND